MKRYFYISVMYKTQFGQLLAKSLTMVQVTFPNVNEIGQRLAEIPFIDLNTMIVMGLSEWSREDMETYMGEKLPEEPNKIIS